MCALDNIVLIKYIEAAILCDDPLERFRLIVSGYVGNIYYSAQQSKGLGTIPTFEGEMLEGSLPNGTYFSGNHVSRKPQTIRMGIKGPDDSYTLDCKMENHSYVEQMANKIIGKKEGTYTLKLKDGSTYTFTYPTLVISNALTQTKHYNFTTPDENPVVIKDKLNNYIAQLKFVKPKTGLFDGLFKKSKIPTGYDKNLIEIKICNMCLSERPVNILSRGHANWLSYCEIDGKCYWRISDDFDNWDYLSNGLNSSDNSTLNREYVKQIKARNYAEADKLLEFCENRDLENV